jgi:hypothetical protein
VVEGQTGSGEHGTEIDQQPLGFRLRSPRHQLTRGRVEPDLTGKKDKIGSRNRLAIRPDR